MKILIKIILIFFVAIFVFFRFWNYLDNYKSKQAGKKYCEENGLKFLKARSYELHTRLYFEKNGIKSWANYETDRNYNITWKKESPIEIIKKKL